MIQESKPQNLRVFLRTFQFRRLFLYHCRWVTRARTKNMGSRALLSGASHRKIESLQSDDSLGSEACDHHYHDLLEESQGVAGGTSLVLVRLGIIHEKGTSLRVVLIWVFGTSGKGLNVFFFLYFFSPANDVSSQDTSPMFLDFRIPTLTSPVCAATFGSRRKRTDGTRHSRHARH